MNKYIKLASLIGCLTTAYAADDHKPSSVKFKDGAEVKVLEPSFEEKFDCAEELLAHIAKTEGLDDHFFPLSQNEIEHIYQISTFLDRINVLLKRPAVLESELKSYVGDNVEVPRFLWAEDVQRLLMSQIKKPDADQIEKNFVRTNIQIRSTGVIYYEARMSCVKKDISVFEFLASQTNIIAWYSHSEPNGVEGTNAVPKTTVRYKFYEVSPVLSLVLESYFPVIGQNLDNILQKLNLKPLTYIDVSNLIGDDNKWSEAKGAVIGKKSPIELVALFSQYTRKPESVRAKKEAEDHLQKTFGSTVQKLKSWKPETSDSEVGKTTPPKIARTKSSRSLSSGTPVAAEGKEMVRARKGSVIRRK